jgi:AraC-type DNA-binding domain-containing proteins
MNDVIEYIEKNLDNEINMNKIAEISCYSVTTFQRMFSIICDMSLSEYIRHRRLTLAAFELQNSNIKIVDLAAKYKYESPEAFTRAFNSLHGVSPSVARQIGTLLKAYPRISFHLTLKGDAPMNYRIEQKDGFEVYGIERIISTKNGDNWKYIPDFWMENISNGMLNKLMQSTGLPEPDEGLNLINAIDCYRTINDDSIPYMLFAFKTEKSDVEGFTVVDVPPSTWAIFKSELHTVEETSNALTGLIKRIYSDWLPTANYTKVENFEFELTYKVKDKYYSEIWIRVMPTKEEI